jgi:hypothetical protein
MPDNPNDEEKEFRKKFVGDKDEADAVMKAVESGLKSIDTSKRDEPQPGT